MITLALSPEQAGQKAHDKPIRYRFDVHTIPAAIQAFAAQSDPFYRWIAAHKILVKCCANGVDTQQAVIVPPADYLCDRQDVDITLQAVIGGANSGKAVFGLTLLGLSFVPGGAVAAQANAGISQNITRHLIGSAASFALQHAVAEQVSPQHYSSAGTEVSSQVQAPSGSAQGGVVPLIYGQVLLEALPVISSSLIVETQKL